MIYLETTLLGHFICAHTGLSYLALRPLDLGCNMTTETVGKSGKFNKIRIEKCLTLEAFFSFFLFFLLSALFILRTF